MKLCQTCPEFQHRKSTAFEQPILDHVIALNTACKPPLTHSLILLVSLFKRQPSSASLNSLGSDASLSIVQNSHQPFDDLPAIRQDDLALELLGDESEALQSAGADVSGIGACAGRVEQAGDKGRCVLSDEDRGVHEERFEDEQRGGFHRLIGSQVESLEEGRDQGWEGRLEDRVGKVGEDGGEGEEVVLFLARLVRRRVADGFDDGRHELAEGFLLVQAGDDAVVLFGQDVIGRQECVEEAGARGRDCRNEAEQELQVGRSER